MTKIELSSQRNSSPASDGGTNIAGVRVRVRVRLFN